MSDHKYEEAYLKGVEDGKELYRLECVYNLHSWPKQGKWMVANTCDIKTGEIYRDSYICSACMKAYTEPSNYCPNCGADMRGDK